MLLASITAVLLQLSQVDGAKDLIDRQSDVEILVGDKTPFQAAYVAAERRIYLSTHCQCPLKSVLFELHNAESTAELESLHRLARAKKISKADFVLGCEKMEFQNALKTMAILEEGIRLGVYPKNVRWNIPKNFNDYYKAQYYAGHAAYHAKNYDLLVNITR